MSTGAKNIYFCIFTVYTTPTVHTMANRTSFVALYLPTGHPFKVRKYLTHC